MSAKDVTEPIKGLGQRARDKGREEGFELKGFGLSPDLDGDGPPHAHLLFLVQPDEDDETPEQQAEKAILAGTLLATEEAGDPGLDERRQQALLDLERSLRDGGVL